MRLTRAGEYGVRAVLYLSAQPKDAVVSRNRIAREMDIPAPFLTKITQQLARAGILESIKGAKGGLRLLRDPEDLNLLDVVEAVIGRIFLNECIFNQDSCKNSPTCSVHKVWARATGSLREILSSASFSSLLEEGLCLLESDGQEAL